MITTAHFDPNSESFSKYNDLFKKAWTLLATPDEDGQIRLRGEKDKKSARDGKQAFSDLAHYLSYIRELVAIDPIYLMLPMDETPFKIYANTREIDVPPEFEKCSGVQSDNYAEIITFTVDRYFDYKDLSTASIAIQWINETTKKEGIDIIQLIDLETEGKDHKIRFGWPLKGEATAAAGNLKFAVRFFTKDKDDNFTYLLNTIPATIPIKETLVMNNSIKPNESDYTFFKEFITNSTNPSYGMPTQVVFVEAPASQASIKIDVPETDEKYNTLELTAQAITSDLNEIVYKWFHEVVGFKEYTPVELETGRVLDWPKIRPSTPLYLKKEEEGKDPTYELFTGEWPLTKPTKAEEILYEENPVELIVSNDVYEIDDEVFEEYIPRDKNGNEIPWEEAQQPLMTLWYEESPEVYKVFGGAWPTERPENPLYTRKTVLKFKDTRDEDGNETPEGKSVAGKYFVRGINYSTERINRVHTDAPALWCEIAPPGEIEILTDLPSGKFYNAGSKQEDILNNTLTLTLKPDGKEPYRTYEVFKIIPPVAPATEATFSSKATGTVDGDTIAYTASEAGSYRIDITSELNRFEKTKSSAICKLYSQPRVLDGVMKVGNNLLDSNIIYTEVAVYNEINGEKTINEDFVDKFHGSWNGSTGVEVGIEGPDDDTPVNSLGTTYTFWVDLGEISKSDSDIGEITYRWTRVPRDSTGPEELITKNDEGASGDIAKITDDGKLVVRTLDPDGPETGAPNYYTYYCTIINNIETEDAGSKSAKSKEYSFTIV